LLLHGTADHVVPFDQSVRMRDRVAAAGSEAELVSIQGGGHGMRYWKDDWHAKLTAWLRRKLRA
jgi:dipeptidyl aminopeptidase/acylaminoacyl peptidase